MNDSKFWIIFGGIFGFMGVALGAFGAHGLREILNNEMIETYKTGVLYQLVHSVIITAIGLSGKEKFGKAALFFAIGIVLFSFSLYLYSVSGISWIAMITPLGGVSFLIGWILLIVQGIKISSKKKVV